MGRKMMNISSWQNINLKKDDWNPYINLTPEMFQPSYKSTNASFYVVIKPILSIESSGQTFDRNMQEELFLNKTVTEEKINEALTTTPVDLLKSSLGINISETADILQITRQAIYDWKSGKAIPSVKNQERINKLITICKKWESENLGPIRHLIRQNIWGDHSLFDLFCKDQLEEENIYYYFDKIKAYILALNKGREHTNKIKEQYGFKQLSNRDKFEKLKKNSRKIG
jgi:hypothetical protein